MIRGHFAFVVLRIIYVYWRTRSNKYGKRGRLSRRVCQQLPSVVTLALLLPLVLLLPPLLHVCWVSPIRCYCIGLMETVLFYNLQMKHLKVVKCSSSCNKRNRGIFKLGWKESPQGAVLVRRIIFIVRSWIIRCMLKWKTFFIWKPLFQKEKLVSSNVWLIWNGPLKITYMQELCVREELGEQRIIMLPLVSLSRYLISVTVHVFFCFLVIIT